MASLFDEPERDSYWETCRQQAKEAMNDREVGLIGQCQAARDYRDLSRKLGYEEDD